jgi:hypothetical protein
MVPPAQPTSYYGRPVLKQPVWKWFIPAYFFTGGLAAGSSAVVLGAVLTGRHRLARISRLASTGAVVASAGLLVADLGRPARFANMLRTAKLTSPMSVGSWVLAAFGPASGAAVASDVLAVAPKLGRVAEVAAAALSPALASYTGVLISDTSVPVWRQAAGELPVLFACSAAASAGAVGTLLGPGTEAGPARILAGLGAAGELASSAVMEHRLGRLRENYHSGRAGTLARLAKGLDVAGLVGLGLGRRRPGLGRLGAGAILLASLAVRFAVFEAGMASARDPGQTVEPQRARLDARGRTAERG